MLNFTIDRKVLIRTLTPLAKLAKLSYFTAAKGVRIEACGNLASFHLCNGSQELTILAPIADSTDGGMSVDVAALLKFAKAAKGVDIAFNIGASQVFGVISCGSYTGRLDLLSPEEAPTISDIGAMPYSDKIDIEAIRQVSYAASVDGARESFYGVSVERTADVINTVATDGYRMAITARRIDGHQVDMIALSYSLLIPLDAVIPLKASPATTMAAQWNARYIRFSSPTWNFVTRLSEAPFPPWRQVVPAKHDRTITLPRLEAMDALESIVKGSVIVLDKGPDEVSTRIACDELEIACSLPVPWIGPKLGVNPRLLLEALASFGTLSHVELELDDSSYDPVTIRNGANIALVMPCRIPN
jgi:hypothetical protein